VSEQDNANVMTDDHAYDDGHWYASTLGHFIGLLVDAGQDSAVCFRVVADSESGQDGQFIRRIDLIVLPDGYVGHYALQCHGVHKTLKALLDAGVSE
jgi:hypothetical protein